MRSIILILFIAQLKVYSFAQEAYTIQESNTGLREIIYNPITEDKAEELRQAFDLSINVDQFRVFGTDIAPFLGFTKSSEAYDQAFELSKNLASDSADHYLLLFKEKPIESDVSINSFRYRIHIKWPSIETYDTLTAVVKESVRRELEININKNVNTNSIYFSGNVFAEGYCIDEFIQVINQIKNGGISINTETLLNAGFEEVPIEGVSIINTNNLDTLNFDYAGLKIDDDFVRDNAESGSEENENLFSTTQIFTDNNAIQSGLFNSAQNAFSEGSTDIVIWYHYFESAEGNKLFYKSRSNITTTEAVLYIDSLFQAFLLAFNIEGGEEILPFMGEGSSRMMQSNCIDFSTWTAYDCILPYAATLKHLTGYSEFSFGSTCGLIDGIYGLLVFMYQLDSGLKEHISHTPLSPLWFIDAGIKVFNNENFKQYGVLGGIWQGIKDKLISDADYFIGIFETITFVIDSYQSVLNEIWRSIEDVFSDITFQNGSANAGYWAGIAIFEGVLAYLTGGSYNMAKITASSLTKFKRVFTGGGIGDILSAAKSWPKNSIRWTKCKILLQGCFLAGTPILIAGPGIGGLNESLNVPIEQVRLFDYILANEAVNRSSRQTAEWSGLFEEGHADLFISPEQHLRDKYDLETSSWYEVVFEEEEGTSIFKLALTADWIHKQGYYKDHTIQLSMPEQGIEGLFRITSMQSLLPRKRPVDKDPLDRYSYQPVTGLFMHQTEEVMLLSFEGGDTIGVTPVHPFYSVTAHAWRVAGELNVGEQVLAYSGIATLQSVKPLPGNHLVYNLEVKDLHNFMVGEVGLLVHNNCWKWDEIYKYDNFIEETPRNHVYRLHSHNSPYNSTGPNAIKSEFAFDWSQTEEDLIAFINAAMEDGLVTLSRLEEQGGGKYAAYLDLENVLQPNQFVGRVYENNEWINTKKMRVIWSEQKQTFVTAFPDIY